MKYIVESSKPFTEVVEAMHETVPKHQFGILHVHDVKATLNAKGVPFENGVNVFEVCNPHKANAVLRADMSLNLALPCRISVWQEDGKTKIGMLRPTAMIGEMNSSKELMSAAEEVEAVLKKIIDECV